MNENISVDNKQKLRFFCNPGYEMVQSLYVLCDPGHHKDCFDWAEKTWDSLTPKLRKEIKKLLTDNSEWSTLSDFWTINPGVELEGEVTDEEFRENILSVCKMKDPYFSWIFLGLTTEEISQDRIAAWLNDPETINENEWKILCRFHSRKYVEYYLNNRVEVKKRLYWVLWTYWNEYFKHVWPSINDYIIRESEEDIKKWEGQDVGKYLRKMHKDVLVDEDYFLFLKEPDYGVPKADISEGRMMLSIFSAPHLMVNIIGTLITGSHDIPFRYPVVTDELSPLTSLRISALNDATRMKIIKLIWEEFHTTQDIAKEIGISEGGVSLHLKQLKNAEMVDVKRIKKHVFYRMRENAVYEISKDIQIYLNRM